MDAPEDRPRPAPLAVCDAGPFIHLDELGCLDLLTDFPQVLAPEAVLAEVRMHRPPAFITSRIEITEVKVAEAIPIALQALCQVFSLHRGEIDALKVAIQHPDGIFLTDDTAARLAAKNLGLEVHGTLGLLLRAIRRRQRSASQVIALLRSIPAVSTMHVKEQFLEEVVRQVESSR